MLFDCHNEMSAVVFPLCTALPHHHQLFGEDAQNGRPYATNFLTVLVDDEVISPEKPHRKKKGLRVMTS